MLVATDDDESVDWASQLQIVIEHFSPIIALLAGFVVVAIGYDDNDNQQQ